MDTATPERLINKLELDKKILADQTDTSVELGEE